MTVLSLDMATPVINLGLLMELLDSNISIPHSKEFSRPAENYLASQISKARNTQNVDTLRAWVFKNDEFMENLYFGAGFEKSLVELTSIVLLDNFEAEKYIKYVNNFKDQSMEIHKLTALKEDYVDWEDKLHELWFRVELMSQVISRLKKTRLGGKLIFLIHGIILMIFILS